MTKSAYLLSAVLWLALSAQGQQHPVITAQPSTPGTPADQPASTIQPVPENHRFPNGEVLHYAAEWRVWNAGQGTLRLDQSGNEERVTGSAESIGFAAVLYKVQDRFESFFDRRTFCSSHITKHTEEGLRRRETSIRFDQARKKAVLDERNPRNNDSKHEEKDIPGCVTDVLSGIFYLGSLPLDVGATFRFPINDGGKTYDVKAYVEAREEIKTDAGVFHTLRVQPTSDSPTLKGRGKIWIWYTDDAAHLPVQMRSRLFWGTLTIRLSRVERQPGIPAASAPQR
jgi:hypothetical protein